MMKLSLMQGLRSSSYSLVSDESFIIHSRRENTGRMAKLW